MGAGGRTSVLDGGSFPVVVRMQERRGRSGRTSACNTTRDDGGGGAVDARVRGVGTSRTVQQ